MSTDELAPAPPSGSAIARSPRERTASWPLADRIGYWLCWVVGIGLCLIALAIVLFMLVKGISYLRPSMFFESPAPSAVQSQSGGFLDPIVGTLIVATVGIAMVPEHGAAVDEIISHASVAVSAVKTHPRGTIRIYEPGME